jgi:MFS family permease
VQTVISIAAIYAQEAMGFGTSETLLMVLAVNVTASIGAFGFGYVQDRVGHARSVAITLVGWCVTTLVAWQATEAALFWVAANLAGLCMGASQSAGRALVGYLSPEARRAEFFGLWGLAVKLSSILGPMTYGAISWISGGNHRWRCSPPALSSSPGSPSSPASIPNAAGGRPRRARQRPGFRCQPGQNTVPAITAAKPGLSRSTADSGQISAAGRPPAAHPAQQAPPLRAIIIEVLVGCRWRPVPGNGEPRGMGFIAASCTEKKQGVS